MVVYVIVWSKGGVNDYGNNIDIYWLEDKGWFVFVFEVGVVVFICKLCCYNCIISVEWNFEWKWVDNVL